MELLVELRGVQKQLDEKTREYEAKCAQLLLIGGDLRDYQDLEKNWAKDSEQFAIKEQ